MGERVFRSLMHCALVLAAVFLLLRGEASAGSCEKSLAQMVSVQGVVEAQKAGESLWLPAKLNDSYCTGDSIRVMKRSRAAIVLATGGVVRLDENTVIVFNGIKDEKTSLVGLLRGAAHFFSRWPRSLSIDTPFVNGMVEGTEFYVKVTEDGTLLTVFEGQVKASNESGTVILGDGQSAFAGVGMEPKSVVIAKPRDAVQWALYYPPVFHYPAEFRDGALNEAIRKSAEMAKTGDFEGALESVKVFDSKSENWRLHIYRASLLLHLGRVTEAEAEIANALSGNPDSGEALALQSIIAITENEKEKALSIARSAVAKSPASVAARVSLSYAMQAHFDLEGASVELNEAVRVQPDNALAWTRIAEIRMSLGEIQASLDAAHKAAELDPEISRTLSVLGFAHLADLKTKEAGEGFTTAISLDQADPMPRLGLGLAKIREGRLEEGRRQIEIAVSLDPDNSLLRSYLGKAYFEEKRDKLAAGQFDMAKDFDPMDPTPYFYDAVRKQTVNRPVEALHDMQRAIELNDNRMVYRSKLLLDSDLAARTAGLARIYLDLGFGQRALYEGWNSVNADPADFSGHRFLADMYSILPRHEIARVSELLQSQLLQPLNITPVQPHLAESNLHILEGSGPSELSSNEFNPLFNRNRIGVQLSGVAGGKDTFGEEVTASAVYGRYSLSAGQFHYETDGFRENNDQQQDIYNLFAQVALSYKTSVQAEFRARNFDHGDLDLLFDGYSRALREEQDTQTLRFGLRHSFSPASNVIGSVIYLDRENTASLPGYTQDADRRGYLTELQYLHDWKPVDVIVGGGYSDQERTSASQVTFSGPGGVPITYSSESETSPRHANAYLYANIHILHNLSVILGASGNFMDSTVGGFDVDKDRFNPKVGIIWKPRADTALRAAAFRILNRDLSTDQTIEPTQVAGFNQFFNDTEGTEAWRYGAGIDHRFSRNVYGGMEVSRRDLEVPAAFFNPDVPAPPRLIEADWEEHLSRLYLYYTPSDRFALRLEYQYERFERPKEFAAENITRLNTHRVQTGLAFFCPGGLIAEIRPSYVIQDGKFLSTEDFITFVSDDDEFFVLDASLSYRLPKRFGIVTIEGRNLLDKEFKFQDTDPRTPTIYPDRVILGKVTLSF